MKRMALALSVTLILGACGGDSGGVLAQDHAPAFTGTWYGTLTISAGGAHDTSVVYVPISSPGKNQLSLEEYAPGGAGGTALLADVTSPTTFHLRGRTCPPVALDGCDAITLTFFDGSGQLSSGSLEVTATGQADGCGVSVPFTASFTGRLGTASLQTGRGDVPVPVAQGFAAAMQR